MNEPRFDIAVLGATGIVGETILSILEEREFPIGKLYPLASAKSAGQTLLFKNKSYEVLDAESFDFRKAQLAFFSAGSQASELYAPVAAAAGCMVIDNTSRYRYEEDIPLIVPEVNAELIANDNPRNIIANPNCSTIQMVVALKPIFDAVGIQRINVATYQAVSGSGRDAISELASQTGELLNGRPVEPHVYPKQIAFNVIPHIDEFQDNGYSREEMKMVWETQKILGDDTIKVNPTTVRVPVFFGHSEAIHLETRKPISAEEVTELLSNAPGIEVVDDPTIKQYPTPTEQGVGEDAVYVGRIRKDISHENGINLWVVADNVRKGAALNAVQIAELWAKRQSYL